MSAPKLERLMNLVAALLHTRVPLAASALHERVDGYSEDSVAFHRQFSRDKEDLREMGVPISVEPVPFSAPPVEGYRIDPDEYYLSDPRLDVDEMAALHLATRLIAIDSAAGRTSLFKLGGMAAPPAAEGAPWASVPADPNLGALFDAIHRSCAVTFGYRGTLRHVAPRALGFQNGHWYVTGWDLDAADDRVYRLDRMSGSVEVGSEVEDPPTGPSGVGRMEPWRIGGDEPVTVTLRVDPIAVPTVTAQVGAERVDDLAEDGSAIVSLEVASLEGFRSWVLGFGADVEVVEPSEVRDGIVAWLDGVLGEAP
ncbi:MAG TPA: WYL domain-containing protein [Acidimicrobiales bacterium]|nr:WYL domain-containing protein [Acidimicrobiales bacterium]